MMQKIQKFGGAMFTPVLLFAFAGIVIGLGTLFTTEVIMGSLAAPTSMWYKCWNVVLQGGWTVFNQLPLLFVVGLPVGMAKKQNARCCMEALVLYLTFHYFLNTILSQWGTVFGVDFAQEVGGSSGLTMIANIKTLDMGMIGALLISGIVIYLHNRFFDTELPEWLGTFSGSTFVFMVGFFVMIPVALIAALVWPKIQVGMFVFQGFVKNAGVAGVWVFVFLERILIPFGLHHLLYSPFWYDNAIVSGGLYTYWATKLPEIAASTASLKSLVPEAGICATGFSKIFGCTGIALAFYATAKPEKRKKVLGLLVPITLTAIFCGVTEPIEFTFLFMAPVLFVVHAVLAACLSTCMYLAGIVGIHAGGVIEMASLNWIPLMGNHWKQYLVMLLIGLFFVAIYFVVFRFLILKFDFKTPGREDDEEIKFNSKAEFREKQASKGKKGSYEELILEGLGGKDNIVDVTNCATRLRVNVKDETLCQNEAYFKSIGAHGCWHLYQPRVEPMWSEAVFKRNEYAPFVEAKRKALEELEGDNKTIHLENHMYMHDSMYCIARITIPSKEIKIKEWLSEQDDVVEFLMNEYHFALGTENIKSKFFHLFSIIEFCEKEYEEHNGSSRLLSDEEVDMVIVEMEKQIDAKKREKIISILKSDLMKVNDIGRVGKLENILKWMGIEKYKQFGYDKAIDKKLLSDIIKLRNKSFHGTKENTDAVEKKYADAVEVLLYIDEKIIDFLMKSSYRNKSDGVCLIYGKK